MPAVALRAWIRRALLGACAISLLPAGLRFGEAIVAITRWKAASQAYERGLTMQASGQIDAAEEMYRQAIFLVPDAIGPRRSLADLLARRGRIEAAIALYQTVLASYPDAYEPIYHRELGVIEFKGGRLQEARRDLQRALELNPSDWLSAYYLGHVYAHNGDSDGARREWRRAVTINPQFRQIHANLRDLGIARH